MCITLKVRDNMRNVRITILCPKRTEKEYKKCDLFKIENYQLYQKYRISKRKKKRESLSIRSGKYLKCIWRMVRALQKRWTCYICISRRRSKVRFPSIMNIS